MKLLFGHSPRLALVLPGTNGRVSMATWGTLVESEDLIPTQEDDDHGEGLGPMSLDPRLERHHPIFLPGAEGRWQCYSFV